MGPWFGVIAGDTGTAKKRDKKGFTIATNNIMYKYLGVNILKAFDSAPRNQIWQS